MLKLKATRLLLVALVLLALSLGAVGAYAATRGDSGDRASTVLQEQEGDEDTDDAEGEDDAELRPWIGILAVPGRDVEGLVIKHVMEDSPAAEAGLEQGDVIRAADGTEVQDVEDLHDIIEDKAIDDTVTLAVIKDGLDNPDTEPTNVDVTLGERPEPKDFGGFFGGLGDIFDGGFEKFLGGEFRYEDEDGNEVTIEALPGTITAVSDDSVTIDVNGDEGERTFDLTDDAKVPDDLAAEDDVTVILRDGAVEAVLPGLNKLPELLPGLPGFGPGGFRFHEGLPFEGLPEGFREGFDRFFPKIEPEAGTDDTSGPEA